MSIPQFETDRLILKAVTLDDAPAYEKHFIDYEVIRYLSSTVPWPYPQKGIIDFINNYIIPNQGKDHWIWGIFLKMNSSELIGVVDLWRDGQPENRGFWLGRKFWGQGIMTEAVEPVTTYAFVELGFEALVLANALGNVRSRRVKEKAGARFLRVEPAKYVDPQFTEQEIWVLEKSAWLQLQPQPHHFARL